MTAGTARRSSAIGTGKTNRLFDQRYGCYIVRVLPGEFYVTGDPEEMVVTVLGSCVAACVRDPLSGFGGMNHFMLPESDTIDWNGVGAANRYGNYAMEALINAVLKSGCPRGALEVKLFGGANFMGGVSMVGQKNAAFAHEYLRREGIPVQSEDVGGPFGRRIHYMPKDGKVQRLLLRDSKLDRLGAQEKKYQSKIQTAPVEGDVDLFI